ncbi:MAG: hypothetical protein V2A58_11265 [Planctomycetota bacterium]
MAASYPPMILADDFLEHYRIAWRMEPGKKDPNNPLMSPQFPWDMGAVFAHGTVLLNPIDGLYKAWYLSTPRVRGSFPHLRQLTYACSEDGVKWLRPELDVYPCEGYEKTNILLGTKMGGITSQVCVMIHPDADPDRRYEMFAYRDPVHHPAKEGPYSCPSRRIEGVPLPPGYDHSLYGLYRHFSGDGIHWRVEGEPVAGSPETKEAYGGRPFVSSDGLGVFQLSDGTYVCHNKVQLAAVPGGYVRNDVGRGECRTIARRESDDGWEWGDTYEIIMTPDWRDPADTQFMDVMMNEYNNGYIGFATVYHAAEGTIDLQLACSRDDRKWWRPARRPCVSLEPLGDIGGGILWPFRGFVIDGDDVHLYYSGIRGLHGDIYSDHGRTDPPHEGAFCRASWKLGRMWAALHHAGNDETAWLTTRPMRAAGKTLFVNALTRGAGKVEAELFTGTPWEIGKPIPGYTRAECNAFHGDEACAPLTWNDRSRVSVETSLLRIYLTDAFLYGFEWR